MEFKKLVLTQETNWLKRTLKSKHLRKTVLYVFLGAAASVLLFFLIEGKGENAISSKDIINNALLGGFFGFFITNSPCARGRC